MAHRPVAVATAAWLALCGAPGGAGAQTASARDVVAGPHGVAPEPAATLAPIDVFLVAGQSNASGVPESAAGSPTVPAGEVLQYSDGQISDANDPVGNAKPGSAWPAFGIAYRQATGHRVLVVPSAMPASSLGKDEDFLRFGHWDPSGTLFDVAVSRTDAALKQAGSRARFCGVLWDQGEADALGINMHFETPDAYKRMLEALIARFRVHFGADAPFFIFETGVPSEGDQPGYQAVRSMQVQVSRETAGAPIVFKDAATFLARGLMVKASPHYTQAGYNEMGRTGGLAVAAFLKSQAGRSCRR